MNKPQSLEEIYEKAPILKEWLKKTMWAPITNMMIPSVLKSADEYIEFLEGIEIEKVKLLREELIALRTNFQVAPVSSWILKKPNPDARTFENDEEIDFEMDHLFKEAKDIEFETDFFQEQDEEQEMGVFFKVTEGKDNVGSFIDIKLPDWPIFEDARNEIMGRSYEDDHNEFNSFEEEQEDWEEFLGEFKGELTLLVRHEGGFRIYTVKNNHLEKFSQIAASPSFFYAPGMSDKKEIEDYLASVEEDELELRASYEKTNFKCDELKINIKINNKNKTLNDYLKKNKYSTYCYITAWNPGSVNKSEKINKKNNLLLLEDLKKYSFFPGLGTPGDGSKCPPEESFLVFGIEEDKAIELMNKYGQKAIVFGNSADGARLIYDEEIEE